MYSEFEQIFKSLFLQKYLGKIYGTSPAEDFSNRRIYLSEYRKILDKVAIGLIYDTFENEKYIAAMLKLNKVERIIVAFNIILEMELSEIAYLLDTSLESTYTQKGTALKRLKEELPRSHKAMAESGSGCPPHSYDCHSIQRHFPLNTFG